jgi:hypothetical protein
MPTCRCQSLVVVVRPSPTIAIHLSSPISRGRRTPSRREHAPSPPTALRSARRLIPTCALPAGSSRSQLPIPISSIPTGRRTPPSPTVLGSDAVLPPMVRSRRRTPPPTVQGFDAILRDELTVGRTRDLGSDDALPVDHRPPSRRLLYFS